MAWRNIYITISTFSSVGPYGIVRRPVTLPIFIMFRVPEAQSDTTAEQGKAELRKLDFKTTKSEFQKPKQNVAPNSITLPLHVVLELSIYSLALPCSLVVSLDFWNSGHGKTW